IFMTLFGGGECDLRLESPETPLDCDIEIHASPRGKRTQRIHLLSSGERALVALSLLFGIFLAKPSPFCLLDEVDAPLDDQNVGRFVRMLNEFKHKTQFIVITHNPRTTTEAADAVYGVTMQEPGVSSFVSVRLQGVLQPEDGAVPVALWDDAARDADGNHAAPADGWNADAPTGAPLSHRLPDARRPRAHATHHHRHGHLPVARTRQRGASGRSGRHPPAARLRQRRGTSHERAGAGLARRDARGAHALSRGPRAGPADAA